MGQSTTTTTTAGAAGMKTAKSIWTRKIDLTYAVFFVVHVLVMLLVDLVPLYPESLRPAFLGQIRTFYIDTYQDKFFSNPPAWFFTYMIMEAVYHMPLSVWVVGALVRDDPLVPVHLLIWAVQSFVTTVTCLAEAWGWPDRTVEQKWNITTLYGPYILLAALMGLDMFCRLKKGLVKSKRD
ncbi:hypothetical protein AJ80_09598 [Polytolypa hystricis UAMH7299]|uniref:Efficient mitochondria targeting-associated protein 19 n=1 Tax=Polytolypa hystricis (strain UAMH7299) TaxID=1447883 RepID=A0A2B7WNA5_POLH7|nr:hypothetical protein AJ80_09598 [Polytolypa hystricis UAMH7299]